MAKKPKMYTADELRDMKVRLETNRGRLEVAVTKGFETYTKLRTFYAAANIRDRSQELLSTVLALDNIELSITQASVDGRPRMLPFRLTDCGMEEWQQEENQ